MVIQSMPVAQTQRIMRRPSHRFGFSCKPYRVQPFMLAPVLPGETMKSALLQARVVTDPVKNPLTGWWSEFYMFYVSFKHMEAQEDRSIVGGAMTDFLVDGTLAPSIANAAPAYGQLAGTSWIKEVYNCVIEHYFRDQADTLNQNMDGDLALAAYDTQLWIDALTNLTDLEVGTDPNAMTDLQDFERLYAQWEMLRHSQLTKMTYEDFLASYGVRGSALNRDRPELIRYVREWTYPSNTVEPTDGVPSSAASWTIKGSADKDRFFEHPGFIFGVFVCRPKVYSSNVQSMGAQFLNRREDWMPPWLMQQMPMASLKEYATATGPCPVVSDSYVVDMRDLFTSGDQFYYEASSRYPVPKVPFPRADGTFVYPTVNEHEALFTVAQNCYVYVDGTVNLNILGQQRDHT